MKKLEKERLARLYEKVREEFSKSWWPRGIGICTVIGHTHDLGYISTSEFYILREHFRANKPKWYRHRKFYKHPNYTGSYAWWWKDERGSKEQRLEFLQYLADKLRKE